jgi:predicted nucleic acid-binding protein
VPGFLPETSCLVAALSAWHEHHERAASEIERRRAQGEAMLLAAPALVETYAVLTRLPRGQRLPPRVALALLDDHFIAQATVVTLAPEGYLALLRRVAHAAVAGGPIYDAVIAACARAAGADTLLTFNERHFLPFAGKGLAIVVPDAGKN